MNYTLLFIVGLIAYTGTRLWLNQRQQRHVAAHRDAVPANFIDKISLNDHQKAADYTRAKSHMATWSIIFDTVILLGWTLGGGIEAVSGLVSSLELGNLWEGTLTILAVMFISSILGIPFSLYRTFVIEERFGFNRSTLKLMVVDALKGIALSLVLGVPLIMLILWLLKTSGDLWWLYAWAAFFAFTLFISWAFPVFIAPLFNKFTPLEDQDLKSSIQSLLQSAGFSSNGIFVADGSRRSSHGNAYFAGFGQSKRIVFYDTLLDNLSKPQVLAVLAHELGHFHHKHVTKNLVMSSVMSLLGFALLAWLLKQPDFFHGLGVSETGTAVGLLLFAMVMPVFTYFIEPLASRLSRKYEFEADRFAAEKTEADDLVSALVQLYQDNASTLTPDPLYSSFYDSHPPAAERIAHLNSCP